MQLARLADALNDGGESGFRRVPKYLRLSEEIAHAIDTGELRTGDRLPGESELADQLPVSLGTVQKALGHLAERGVVERRHGTGTFVAGLPTQLHDLWHFRFLDEDGLSLLPVFTRVTHVGRVETGNLPDEPWTDFLGGAEGLLRIDREIDVNHEFSVASRIFLPGGRFGALADEPANNLDNANIRGVLRERFGAPTTKVVERIGAETMPDDVCNLLRRAIGEVGMVIHILGFGFRDAPLTYQVVYCPADTRRLEIQPRRP